jgi:hypothetical protein
MQGRGLRCTCGELEVFLDAGGGLRACYKPCGEGSPVLTIHPPAPEGRAAVSCEACGAVLRFDLRTGTWSPEGFGPLPD